LLFQLRMEHTPLNKHLYCIAKKTIHYFIITCPQYMRQCHTLQIELGLQTNHIKNLLNNPKYIKPLLRFIASTRRMEQIFGNVTPPIDKEDEEI
ncbi:hypothetical protein CY34DRAFT_75091, partial [Suillus luteus UH-Slu-Lm8-n1]